MLIILAFIIVIYLVMLTDYQYFNVFVVAFYLQRWKRGISTTLTEDNIIINYLYTKVTIPVASIEVVEERKVGAIGSKQYSVPVKNIDNEHKYQIGVIFGQYYYSLDKTYSILLNHQLFNQDKKSIVDVLVEDYKVTIIACK